MRNPISPAALFTADSHALAADSAGESAATAWLVSLLPDTTEALGAWILGTGLVVAVLCGAGYRHLMDQGKKERSGLDGATDALSEGFQLALEGAGKFIAGRPVWGEPESEATFWKSGAVLPGRPAHGIATEEPAAQAREKQGPSRLTAWHQCPGVVRSAVRLMAVAAAAGLLLAPYGTCLALVLAVPAALFGVWAFGGGTRHRTDASTYGPGLWAALVQLLGLSQEDQARGQTYWMRLPDDLSKDTTRVVIRLPLRWIGTERERAALAYVVHSRLPGEWTAVYTPRGRDPHVVFTPKPPALPEPELPTQVEWIPSDDPARVYVGETLRGPRYVDTETETPHWGISGGTGDGKTTCLLMPIVHGRQHGALVDCITMKAAAFKDIEGEPGIRIHKTGRQAVACLAEFYCSMKAAEALQGTEEGDRLPGRILVIDEFASFVKSAKIWWKYGLNAKGMPPFEAWFHMILMQGRSANHKIIIGAHTFTRELFGDTETRDLVGTKGIVGPASNPKWGVTYGLDAPRVDYRHDIKGRGVIGVTGSQDIEEIQYAYITPYARDYLRACPPAPPWHAQGALAPWITEGTLKEAEQELAIADFLPGQAFMRGVTLVTGRVIPAPGQTSPRSVHMTKQPTTTDVPSKDATDHAASAATHHSNQIDQAEETQLPVFSLRQACEAQILPLTYGAARKRLMRAKRSGVNLPDGVTVDGTTYYTAQELTQWWTLVSSLRLDASLRR